MSRGKRCLLLVVSVALSATACSQEDPVPAGSDFDDLEWTVHNEWVVVPDDPIRLTALEAIDFRLLAGGVDTNGGFVLVESTDLAESWSEVSIDVPWTGPAVRGWPSDGSVLFTGLIGSHAAVYVTGEQVAGRGPIYPDGKHPDGSVPIALTVDGASYVVVGMRGNEDSERALVWTSDDAGETWRSTPLPTEPGVRSVANSVAASDELIVVGGHIELRELEFFSDGAARRAVVWASSDDGATWEQVVLDSLGMPDASVRLVVATEDGFRALGMVRDVAQDPVDTPDLAQWSTDGNVAMWGAPFVLTEPGHQQVYRAISNTTEFYVVGRDIPDSSSLFRLAIWQSTPHGLARLEEFELPGNLLDVAGAVRVGESWLVAGMRDDGEAFGFPTHNWLITGKASEPEDTSGSP